MTMRQRRVIVGVEDSVTGWAALRTAVEYAQQRDAELHAVHVVANGASPLAMAAREELVAAAQYQIADAFTHALGGPPRTVPVRFVVGDGSAGPALVRHADRPDDLLVLGARRRHHWFGHQPGRYCAARAACPVLIVPAPEFARTGSARALSRQLRRDLDRLPSVDLARISQFPDAGRP